MGRHADRKRAKRGRGCRKEGDGEMKDETTCRWAKLKMKVVLPLKGLKEGGGDDKKEEITVGSRRQCEHKVGREVGKGKRRCG